MSAQETVTPVKTEAPIKEECPSCREIREKYRGFGPSHDGSRRCESGSIASGGTRSHCSCDACF